MHKWKLSVLQIFSVICNEVCSVLSFGAGGDVGRDGVFHELCYSCHRSWPSAYEPPPY
jgi:hypothetical protein